MADRHLVLWDGECGLCRRGIAFFERRDEGRRMRFVAYQDAPSPPMTEELAEACRRSVHVVCDDGTVLHAGRASLFILAQIGWWRTARVLATPPLVWLVELSYAVVSRNRHIFSRILFRREPA
jgi:predicted DCC family thiol-disulfide oxidoreductase YuxK